MTAAALLAVAALLGAGPSSLAERKIALGDELAAKGDHRGALFAYQDAVALDGASAAARLKMGDAYQQLGHPDQAIRQWEDAALLSPREAPAARERIARAKGGATTSAPLSVTGSDDRGAGPSAPSVAPPETAPSRRAAIPTATAPPETPARVAYEAGVALIGKGLFAEALSSLDEAVRRDPALAVAYAARASARFGLGRLAEAAEDYQAALARDGRLATPLYGLAECHRRLGEPGAAARYYAAYAQSKADDAREDLQVEARRRSVELAGLP